MQKLNNMSLLVDEGTQKVVPEALTPIEDSNASFMRRAYEI